MSCLSCENGGYRKLCFYDSYHNTCKDHPDPKSFACVAKGYGTGKQCILQNKPPGDGSYPSMSECQKHCQDHPDPKSFACVAKGLGSGTGKQCILQNKPPGDGSYPSMSECQKHCGGSGPLGQFRFRCVGHGYGAAHRGCIREDGPAGPGTFSNEVACKRHCGNASGPPNYSFYGN